MVFTQEFEYAAFWENERGNSRLPCSRRRFAWFPSQRESTRVLFEDRVAIPIGAPRADLVTETAIRRPYLLRAIRQPDEPLSEPDFSI